HEISIAANHQFQIDLFQGWNELFECPSLIHRTEVKEKSFGRLIEIKIAQHCHVSYHSIVYSIASIEFFGHTLAHGVSKLESWNRMLLDCRPHLSHHRPRRYFLQAGEEFVCIIYPRYSFQF